MTGAHTLTSTRPAERRPVIIASDLDRTLIYSRAAAGTAEAPLQCVEHYQGAEASFMTTAAAARLTTLAAQVWLVPVTTRTCAQLARVSLPGGPTPWAIAANGASILREGVVDQDWAREVAGRLAGVLPLREFQADLRRAFRFPEPGSGWLVALRDADGFFCYAVVERDAVPSGLLAEVSEWAATRGWRMSVQGRKVYWVPRSLTKAAAVAEVSRRVRGELVLGAGDSLLDLDLLLAADRGIVAAHGEVAGHLPPNSGLRVTENRGVAAGEEICEWFGRNLDSTMPSVWPGSRAIVG